MKWSNKSMLEVVKSQRLWILKLLLAVQLLLLGYLFFSAIGEDRYFVAHEDEVINFCSAKLFSETCSVQAEGCITEDVSRIGRMNWYGPGYHLLYGSMRSLFGDSPTLFIQLHFAFALVTVLMVFFLPVPVEIKLLIANTLVFTQQFTSYIFTYFPEALHLFLALVLIFLLILIHRSKHVGEKNRYVILFITLVLILTIVRVTTIFWLAALIGLSESRSMALKMTFIFVTGVLMALLYMKFFTAPPYAGEMQKIDQLYEFNLVGFVLKTLRAMARSAFTLVMSGSVSVYFLLTLILAATGRWWKSKEQFLLASLLVSLVLMAALMAFYSSHPWYFLKQSAVLIPLLIVALMLSAGPSKLKYGILVMSLVTFLFTFQSIRDIIRERRDAFTRVQGSQPFIVALQQLPQFITEQRSVIILWCYNEYDFGGATEALLPFSTKDHQPILYTTNIVSTDETSEVKFQLHNKLKVDYLLSRMPVESPSLQQVHATGYYHFYKIIGQ